MEEKADALESFGNGDVGLTLPIKMAAVPLDKGNERDDAVASLGGGIARSSFELSFEAS